MLNKGTIEHVVFETIATRLQNNVELSRIRDRVRAFFRDYDPINCCTVKHMFNDALDQDAYLPQSILSRFKEAILVWLSVARKVRVVADCSHCG